jgi:2-methylisocitrate lyase-like PEP mutase family enzyme
MRNEAGMDLQVQIDKAQLFRDLHACTDILLLPNAWDAGSARLFARRGFSAIATTSGGMAWSLGYADGERAPLVEVLAALTRITRVTCLPVTADLEAGYGESPTAVGATVRAAIAAGVVGINLEDGLPGHGPLRRVDDAAARIHAARSAAATAGVPLVINARVDVWMQHAEDRGRTRLDAAVQRAQAYLAAGADCIFPLGLSDAATLAALVQAIDAPINVAAGPQMPGLRELAQLGVARVSTATRFATLALAAVEHAVASVRATGKFDGLASDFSYGDAQQLFEQP